MDSEACLTEETVAQLVEGRLEGEPLARAERHLSTCDACVRLVSAVGRAMTSSADAGPSEEPRELAHDEHVGRYVILEAVGAGAMGRVYAAHDPALDRKVALKLLHARAATPELEARLLREAKAMARLSHPEVITVHDAGRHGAQLFIAMEFVDGGTLRQWLAERPRSWRETLAVYLRAGRGLARAHAAGIVHRDFKPDNVLIGHDGRVRVTDFGLASAPNAERSDPRAAVSDEVAAAASAIPSDEPPLAGEALTRTGTLLGTPAYMAPEQLAGRSADARSDVYAFCVSLYEALYGERPFGGHTIGELQRRKLAGQVPPPSSTGGVPPRVRRALLAGLRPNPEGRPASMDVLLDTLIRATTTRKGPWLAGAAVLGVASLVAGVSLSRRHRAATPSIAPSTSALAAGRCTRAACTAANGGAASVCRASDGVCVRVASEDCTALAEPADLADERTVWLGAMFPTKGQNAEAFGRMSIEATDFARQEVARATSGLSGSSASMPVRRIAVAMCDDGGDPMRAAHHLVDDVGVPAILGFSSGKEIENVAGSLLIPRRVLTMASLTSSPLITRIPQPASLPRMVWRTSFSIEAVADATAAFLHDTLEPRRAPGTGETRVTLARIDSGLGLWFGETLFRKLTFNGKPAVDNGTSYQELTFADSLSDPDVAAFADRVARTAPTFLVLLGASSDTARIVAAVEATGARPTYVITSDSTAIVAPFIGKSADRRRRVVATTSVTGASEARFVIRFNAAHEQHPVTRTLNPGMSYDAFYVLAYATFALGDHAVDGPSIARAIERLIPPGRRVETGTSDLFEALTALSRGENIDLVGPSGSLDFDPATGEASSDLQLLCPGVDAQASAAGDVESGVVFRAGAKAAVGTMRCP